MGLALLASLPAYGVIHDPRAVSADPVTADGPIASVLEGLGSHSRRVTTSSEASAAVLFC